ncbi:hypothetical protein [Thiolapillus brandeum]|uniref:Peptidase C39-like domain-containing protein n=1 Tax=Thiolapillus brandeum TaxID=1076588 RepID=A0A7U6GG72_9GAMM|nr:hypothetical protein [Thiolapillus brandeum]BAO43040.1 hypothetical protein TBH_C0092 [Thiolapillus brandeum]
MEERLQVKGVDQAKVDSLEAVFQERLVQKGLGSNAPRHQPLQAIMEMLSKLGARTAVIQKKVQDPDFLAEYAAYYSRWTGDVPRYCDRIHFFSDPPVSENVLEVIDQMADAPDAYLGFVTLRPISMSPVAASILKPLVDVAPSYLLSNDEFVVNLAGRRFAVNGTPFMQQDNAVGACAQASIWMALRTLRKKAGQAAFNPAQITDAATKYAVVGRVLPNRAGLTVQQITEAIRTSGYAPHVLPVRQLNEPASEPVVDKIKFELYPYVESGIPVLLLLFPDNSEGHAVVVIGHGWNRAPARLIEIGHIDPFQGGAKIRLVDAASWVEPFIIHNDNSGPYLALPDVSSTGYALNQACYAIPLLQPEIFIDGAEAKRSCIKLLSDSIGINGQSPDGHSLPSDLVVRTYLIDRSEFRKNILKSAEASTVKAYFRMKWMPKRIWVTEFNLLDGYEASPDHAGRRLGQIILDPAAEAEEGAFLSIYLSRELLPSMAQAWEGIVIDRDVFTGEIEAFPVETFDASTMVRSPVN